MAKICTSIEQSKRLIELRLDVNTADMCYKCLGEDPYDLIVRPYSDWKEKYKGLLISGDANVIPAWSLSTLLELIPNLDERSPILCRNMRENKWWVFYLSTAVDAVIQTVCYDNPLDAVFEMICLLKENKKM